jgi:hypothetical protein
MFAVQHSVVTAMHEDRLREIERSALARSARQSRIVERLRKAFGLGASRAIYSRPAEYPAQTCRTLIMAAATPGGYADAGRQN